MFTLPKRLIVLNNIYQTLFLVYFCNLHHCTVNICQSKLKGGLFVSRLEVICHRGVFDFIRTRPAVNSLTAVCRWIQTSTCKRANNSNYSPSGHEGPDLNSSQWWCCPEGAAESLCLYWKAAAGWLKPCGVVASQVDVSPASCLTFVFAPEKRACLSSKQSRYRLDDHHNHQSLRPQKCTWFFTCRLSHSVSTKFLFMKLSPFHIMQ